MSDQPKSHFERFLAPILASRFFTISALIHLVIVILIGGRVLFNKYVEPPDFQSAGDSVSADLPPAPPDTPDNTLPPAPTLAAPPPPSTSAPAANLAALTSLNTTNSAFAMPVPAIAPPTLSKNMNAPTSAAVAGTGPAVALPGAMSGRGNGRESVGRSYGEKGQSEEAVLRALRWLQSKQNGDGTWGQGEYHDAWTGLALLCFLGHGDIPQTSHEFGVVVTNALNAMITEGNAHQGRFSGTDNFGGTPAAYMHAICTYALCEAYTMTKDQRLAPLVQQSMKYIIQGQRPDGGWAYSYDLGPDVGGKVKSDTSVSGWQIQALKAAHLTGISPMDKDVLPVFAKAIKNMDRVFDEKNGTFGYRTAGDNHPYLTGVGVLAKLYWFGRPDRTVREGFKTIESKDLNYRGPDCNLYAWYYDTQAAFQAQSGHWDWWNQRFQDQLTNNQSSDGSWPPTDGNDIGSFAKSSDDQGALYRTTLCCLMLEVFYRYLPTTQESALSGNVEGL
ncbi:MAG TPA: prenyltransferase/squalene oxidase repeat-containing protein [Chthoniobacteraceae bacterium]|jgi:hypothetical protein|nr:prenyltransferase/squalene oxidase repeat-containing protein [Chthoniobacteraceae bacterium]